jgi:hypothetical protein
MFFDYKMKIAGVGFGDVLISKRIDSSNTLDFKQTELQPPPNINPNVVVKFLSGGTGFIIKKLDPPLKRDNLFIQGIIATAAHVIIDLTSNEYSKEKFQLKVMKKNFFAIPIKSYASVYANFSPSEKSGYEYCLPYDVAILVLMTKKIINFPVAELDLNGVSVGNCCTIAGYPVRPSSSIFYSCPIAEETELELIEKAFHNFKRLVFSQGNIVSMNDHLLDLSCSTTSGMSGSPTFNDQGKVCGIYVGGPPLPGQRQLYKAIYCYLKQDFLRALCIVRSLEPLDRFYRIPIFSRLKKSFTDRVVPSMFTFEEIQKFEESGSIDLPPNRIVDKKIHIKEYSLIAECFLSIFKCVENFSYEGKLEFNVSVKLNNSILLDIEQHFQDISNGNLNLRQPLV